MEGKDRYLYIGGKPVRVTEEVYREYYRGEDRERYFMGKLKKGHTRTNPATEEEEYIPCREQSYEQLLERARQFPAAGEPVEDIVERAALVEKLQAVLKELSEEELELIEELFYLERTEREAAGRFAVSQNTIHYRKKKVLEKLKGLMEK